MMVAKMLLLSTLTTTMWTTHKNISHKKKRVSATEFLIQIIHVVSHARALLLMLSTCYNVMFDDKFVLCMYIVCISDWNASPVALSSVGRQAHKRNKN